MKEKDLETSFGTTPDDLRIGETKKHISLSADGLNYEIRDHRVFFNIVVDDIPCVINSADAMDVLLACVSPDFTRDSVHLKFLLTGREEGILKKSPVQFVVGKVLKKTTK